MSVTVAKHGGHGADAQREERASRDYLELLDRLHCRLLPRTYCEIGVNTGKSLALVLPGTTAVGVDPEPRIVTRVPRSASVVSLTSDDFFQRYSASHFFGADPLDFAFIDGMHLFEFALRDFINLEKWCAPGSVIVAHDCYPIDEAAAARERTTRQWTGDVWKLVLCLKEFRPDLKVSTVDVPPSGLCIITGLDPTSRELEANYTEICERFIGLDYSAIAEGTDEKLNAVTNDWAVVRDMLPAAPFRAANSELLRHLRSARFPSRNLLARGIKRSVPPSVKNVLAPARRFLG